MGAKGRLYTTGDIADLLGLSRQWVLTMSKDRTKDFPESFDDMKNGSVWLVADVKRWIKKNRPELAEDPETE